MTNPRLTDVFEDAIHYAPAGSKGALASIVCEMKRRAQTSGVKLTDSRCFDREEALPQSGERASSVEFLAALRIVDALRVNVRRPTSDGTPRPQGWCWLCNRHANLCACAKVSK